MASCRASIVMRYISTRGGGPVSFEAAVLAGWADDGTLRPCSLGRPVEGCAQGNGVGMAQAGCCCRSGWRRCPLKSWPHGRTVEPRGLECVCVCVCVWPTLPRVVSLVGATATRRSAWPSCGG